MYLNNKTDKIMQLRHLYDINRYDYMFTEMRASNTLFDTKSDPNNLLTVKVISTPLRYESSTILLGNTN